MKKTYILYCYIISVILMPFKWFEPEHMTDLSEWGFKCISNLVGIALLVIGVLLIQAKRIEAKERILAGIGLVAIVLGEFYTFFTWYKDLYYPAISLEAAKNQCVTNLLYRCVLKLSCMYYFFYFVYKGEEQEVILQNEFCD